MYGLAIQWERCVDGVEAFEQPAKVPRPGESLGLLRSLFAPDSMVVDAPPGTPPWVGYRYKSDRTQDDLHTIDRLDDLIAVRFANAKDRKRKVAFLSRFGFPALPYMRELSDTTLDSDRSRLRDLLLVAGGPNPGEAVDAVNSALLSPEEFWASPTIGPPTDYGGVTIPKPARTPLTLVPLLDYPPGGSRPRLALRPTSLFDFMAMECAMVAANEARVSACAHCGDLYLTGPLTDRRSHSLYCKDSCRVMALRKRRSDIEAVEAARPKKKRARKAA